MQSIEYYDIDCGESRTRKNKHQSRRIPASASYVLERGKSKSMECLGLRQKAPQTGLQSRKRDDSHPGMATLSCYLNRRGDSAHHAAGCILSIQ